jgi:hypothetical protein
MPKTNLSETGVLNFRSVLGGMTLLLAGCGTVIAAKPAQAAFSFVQENYQVPGFASSVPTGVILVEPSTGQVTGNFEGNDFNGDGKITCLQGGSCEISSLRAGFSFTAQGTEVRYVSNLPVKGDPVTFSSGLGGTYFAGSTNTLNLSYTLADPSSLNIFAVDLGDMQILAIGSGGSSVTGFFQNVNSGKVARATTVFANSPVIVSEDSTAAPEPATMAGLLLAGGVGVWLKRRTPGGRGLVASSQ